MKAGFERSDCTGVENDGWVGGDGDDDDDEAVGWLSFLF